VTREVREGSNKVQENDETQQLEGPALHRISRAQEYLRIGIGLLEKTFAFLASIKLAVIVIVAMGVVSAWGTFVEAEYDAHTAKVLVYHSPWMIGVLALFVTNLVCVAFDRWPWKKRHIPFLLAHLGLVTIVVGAWVTKQTGVDGSLVLNIGETNRWVSTSDIDLRVYASLGGDSFRQIHQQSAEFLQSPPTLEDPLVVDIGSDIPKLKIRQFYPYAIRKETYKISDKKEPSVAMSFALVGPVAKVSRWVFYDGKLESSESFGPLKVSLVSSESEAKTAMVKSLGVNALWVWLAADNVLGYAIQTKDSSAPLKVAKLKVNEGVMLPWMGFEFKLLDLIAPAERVVEFEKRERPSEVTTSAIEIEFAGESQWVGLNSGARMFTNDLGYILTYGNRRLDLGFDVELKEFRIGRYQGTMRAKSYESEVLVPGLGASVISMNEPLKHEGFTFYQASFQEDSVGRPVASVLSVNKDPGRFWKYLGSLLLVVGSAMLFLRRLK